MLFSVEMIDEFIGPGVAKLGPNHPLHVSVIGAQFRDLTFEPGVLGAQSLVFGHLVDAVAGQAQQIPRAVAADDQADQQGAKYPTQNRAERVPSNETAGRSHAPDRKHAGDWMQAKLMVNHVLIGKSRGTVGFHGTLKFLYKFVPILLL
jgi:hypothetical protein